MLMGCPKGCANTNKAKAKWWYDKGVKLMREKKFGVCPHEAAIGAFQMSLVFEQSREVFWAHADCHRRMGKISLAEKEIGAAWDYENKNGLDTVHSQELQARLNFEFRKYGGEPGDFAHAWHGTCSYIVPHYGNMAEEWRRDLGVPAFGMTAYDACLCAGEYSDDDKFSPSGKGKQ